MSADPIPDPRRLRRSHNHLDRARRDRGECPACDDDWQHQDARVADISARYTSGRYAETDAVTRRASHDLDFDTCQAIAIDGGNHHCDLPPRHRGKHHCPSCHQSWSPLR